MSLDVLLTEAAESGGPPRFTEDDIERRVAKRHQRRRRAATGLAVLAVLAGCGLGLLVASRDRGADAPTEPGAPIGSVPITDDSLLGGWRAAGPEGDASFPIPEQLRFEPDGTYSFTGGCNVTGGRWDVFAGELTLLPGGGTLMICGTTTSRPMVLDDVMTFGVATFYEDGLLRVATADATFDYFREDAETPPDPDAPRADAARPVTFTDEAMIGGWAVAGTDGGRPALTFTADGRFRWDDCSQGEGAWGTADGRLQLQNIVVTAANPCPPLPDRPHVGDTLGGSFRTLTTEGNLVLLGGSGAVVLRVDRSISENGPAQSLRDAYVDMGVEPCCRENGDGLTRRGFVWAGHEVGVEALLIPDAPGQLFLDEPTGELDGRVVSGQSDRGTELAFDCGGYRFGMYSWDETIPDDALLDAGAALLAVLPCQAFAPT
jgi:hypothetical protein